MNKTKNEKQRKNHLYDLVVPAKKNKKNFLDLHGAAILFATHTYHAYT